MRIGFVGAGNMAMALAGAITASRPDTGVIAYDPDPARLDLCAREFDDFTAAAGNLQVTEGSDVTFLAVKPQYVEQACRDLRDADGLVVSIAAGVRLATLESWIPNGRLVRVMPNTPGLVGEMAAGYARGSRATAEDSALVGDLLSEAGVAVELEESLLDAVTGLSGSGPAFVARLIQAFVDAGVSVGLPEEVSRRLAIATFRGTATLLLEKDLTADELVTMVSSPGGTTIAGRRVLESSGYKDIILRTVTTATARSRELGA